MAGYNYPGAVQHLGDCHWVPPYTPYNVRELLAARNVFRQCFQQHPSNAMLSLIKKSQFAIHGEQGARASFHNNYFADINQEALYINSESFRPEEASLTSASDASLSNTSRDTSTHEIQGSGQQLRCVKKTYQPLSDALPERSNRKRNLPGNENMVGHPDLPDSPLAKKTNIAVNGDTSNQTFSKTNKNKDSENLNTLWTCDYCCYLEKSVTVMQDHLKSNSHFSASLSRCVSRKSLFEAVSIISPAKLTEPSVFCKKRIPVCPEANCSTVYQNVYQCSLHYARSHNKPHMINRFALGSVLHEKEILFHANKQCGCGKKLTTMLESLEHLENCSKFGKREITQALPNSFIVYLCCNCDSFIYTLNKMLKHIMGVCMKNSIGFRVLQVKKSQDSKMLLPNNYAVLELDKEIERLRGPDGSNIQGNKDPKLLNKITAVQTLKEQFHNFMKLRYEDYDKGDIIDLT